MNPLRSLHFRAAIAIAATLFFVSALVTGVLVYQRQQALEHKLRENLIWAVYQFDREVRELRMVVAEEQKTPTPPALMDDSELLLRLDILYSRVQLLQSGQLGSMLAGMPDLHARLMAMLPRIEVLDSAIMDLASRQARDASLYVQILSRLASLQEQAGELLLNINAEAAIQRTRERSELLNLYALALSLVLLMTLSGIVLVVALIVESRGRASKTRKLEERTRELDGMVQLAQAASRAKSEFMAIMSHEIRTPLNGMVGVSDLIGEEVSTRRGQQYLAMLRQSAESLQAVINDVLDYSKIEAGKLELDQRCFSLPEFLDSLAAHYHRQTGSAGKGCSRIFLEERADDLPVWVKGDVNRLRQVLTNLLNNAFKFCPQGTIRLRASLEDGETLHFEVHDSGCGIAADQVSQLFAPFTQVDTSIARRHEGTGLGLAICKRLVEAMGGEVGVESHLGLGSRFWCRVPLPVLTVAEACPQQAVGDAPLPHASVLVVEDNEVNQSLARAMLEYLGQQVTVVEDGEQALEWLAQAGNDVDLVFMDMQMPVLDGVETTRRWRQHEAEQPASARLPIIAMTANVMQEDARRCIDAGMQGCCTNPSRVMICIGYCNSIWSRPLICRPLIRSRMRLRQRSQRLRLASGLPSCRHQAMMASARQRLMIRARRSTLLRRSMATDDSAALSARCCALLAAARDLSGAAQDPEWRGLFTTAEQLPDAPRWTPRRDGDLAEAEGSHRAQARGTFLKGRQPRWDAAA